MSKRSVSLRRLTMTAMFAAIASILMFFEFPLPFLPPFLKIDLSGVAVLVAAFMFGPITAVLVTLIKDAVNLFSSTTAGIGQLADFIMLSSFAVTAAVIYRKRKDKKHALTGCLAATVVMTVLGVITNKFMIIPFYSKIMPIDAIINMCRSVNPSIDSMNAYYLFGVVPFNIIKGLLLSAITVLLYKKLSVIIKGAGLGADAGSITNTEK